jgi:hypothetical protein
LGHIEEDEKTFDERYWRVKPDSYEILETFNQSSQQMRHLWHIGRDEKTFDERYWRDKADSYEILETFNRSLQQMRQLWHIERDEKTSAERFWRDKSDLFEILETTNEHSRRSDEIPETADETADTISIYCSGIETADTIPTYCSGFETVELISGCFTLKDSCQAARLQHSFLCPEKDLFVGTESESVTDYKGGHTTFTTPYPRSESDQSESDRVSGDTLGRGDDHLVCLEAASRERSVSPARAESSTCAGESECANSANRREIMCCPLNRIASRVEVQILQTFTTPSRHVPIPSSQTFTASSRHASLHPVTSKRVPVQTQTVAAMMQHVRIRDRQTLTVMV